MNRDHFWLTDRQFARIAPHAPTVYGPRKTLYNRYVRWAAKGVWVNLFHSLARAGGPSAQLLIDSSAVKAHRSASGGKGGSSIRQSAARAADGSYDGNWVTTAV